MFDIGLAHKSTFSCNRPVSTPVVDFLSFRLQISFETSLALIGIKSNDGPEFFSLIELMLGWCWKRLIIFSKGSLILRII